MQTRAFNLMKIWCDQLLDYTIKGTGSPYTDGGLICPACHVIHGRIADLVLPLTVLWDKTGEKNYLDAAVRLVEWSEFNLTFPDGSWRNDAGNQWRGISAFSAMALGDALLHYEEKLPADIAARWRSIFVRLSDFCLTLTDICNPVINYYAGSAAELAMAWKLTGDTRYLDEANRKEAYCRRHFDENGLLCGEGQPHDGLSGKGCHHIDMGYNTEESLPLLMRHAHLLGDAEKIAFYKARMLDQLEFLLPCGAIDNSWGTRHNKWTYWGSRTSDGALEGLALEADDPLFAKAMDAVLGLYERCTHDGLLSLPMSAFAGEPTCLHHSFCHAKALAAVVLENPPAAPAGTLPREREYGVKAFQNGNLLLVSKGGWRATFSSIDLANYRGSDNGGGSMNLLWHERVGAVCAASMADYSPSEPLNMQYLRKSAQTPCMTPHIRFADGRRTVLDKGASLTADGDVIRAAGEGWSASYAFDGDSLTITAKTDKPAVFSLPIVCPPGVSLDERMTITASAPIKADYSRRAFNQVPGFCMIPIELPIDGSVAINIIIR
ncbi:MAG: hypothetical protein IJ493_02975 [Clostridia bacterium]|nr:hypothetical protein [Clostridia bacterium]